MRRAVLLIPLLLVLGGCGLTKVVTVPLEFAGDVASTTLNVVNTGAKVVGTAADVVGTGVKMAGAAADLVGVLPSPSLDVSVSAR